MSLKGFVIAGTQSGCGKTTITLGLLAALVGRGMKVAPFKVGPDFIDPGHHSRITDTDSRNLDGWMLSEDYNRICFYKNAHQADVAVVEGVMGLYDGYDGRSEAGSTAQMAKWLNLPILLVVDARSMARSAAALIQGFERFDKNLSFAGVLFNYIGSQRHLQYLKDALRDNVKMPCLGGIQRDETITIPERHLGLVTQEDHPLTPEAIQRLAGLMQKNIDLDAFIERLPALDRPDRNTLPLSSPEKPLVRIGVATDNAFCFYYRDNLDLLVNHGAEIIPFSPLKDRRLPDDLDGLYFGGGYPELFARALSLNTGFHNQILTLCNRGMPIYAECGGFMYLCRTLCDLEGNTFPMTGCFPFETAMFHRLRSLGYREITLQKDTLIGQRGQTIRGHEFHYSKITASPDNCETIYRLTSRTGMDQMHEGFQIKRTLGSYVHLHFGSHPDVALNFVKSCLDYQHERNPIDETRGN